MTNPAGNEARCECGAILATPSVTPASLIVTNRLHKQSIQLTASCLSIRGRCPGCSKLHTLSYPVMAAEKKPAKIRKVVGIIGQLSLF